MQLDEAPAIRIVLPEERSLLAASDDIFPLTIEAKDDLPLEKIEYHLRSTTGLDKTLRPRFARPHRQEQIEVSIRLGPDRPQAQTKRPGCPEAGRL